jgi:diamine N-acetyltransferase
MIKGDRIQLIPLNDECFDLTLNWINDPDLRYFTGSRFPVSKKEHELWFIQKATDKYNKTYAIQIIENNCIIGIAGNNDYDPINRSTNPFIYIGDPKYRSKGYGVEAFSLIVDFCFSYLNVHRVYGFFYHYNKASQKMLERCGYLIEGTLREHWFKDGVYHDVIVMGKINDK